MQKNDTDKLANGGKIYLEDGILYKFFDDNSSFIEERARNVIFLRENSLFSPKIGVTFYDGTNFLGFSQEYIPNSRTFKDGIGDEKLSDDKKNNVVIGIFKKLKMLHERGFLVGDVHSRNLIFDENDGYIVDLDEIRLKGTDDFKSEELYQLQMDEASPKIDIASEYTDNVKATVSALSLLYGFDLEELIVDKILRVDVLREYVDTMISDNDFKQDVFRVLNSNGEVVYFDEILEKKVKVKQ